MIRSVNPATEEVIASFDTFTPAQVDAALEAAWTTQRAWRHTSFDERSTLLRAVAGVLRQQRQRWAGLITAEMGKPVIEAEAEIEKCAWNCDYYAEHAVRFLADEPAPSNATESFVAFQPLGVVLAIMPWNFPFWQVFRFLAPALMAGNTAILKHASNVSQCALAIEEVLALAGVPDGGMKTVLVPGGGVAQLIADERIAAVTLTGSSEVGESVASTAGKHLKKQVLELGGADPFIVLADADLRAAAMTAARARNQNSGQSCIAAKRFIVEASVVEQFTAEFVSAVDALRVGDPSDRTTNVGPLARRDLLDSLEDQVSRAVRAGADVALGGSPIAGRGYFYRPTVLVDVDAASPVFVEETFGPVAAVITADSPDHAVELANQSQYGLGGALWSRDTERAKALVRRVESGAVFINGMTASDPRLPFGGVKRSGYGRELSSYGIREFTNIQTIWVGPATEPVLTAPAD